MRLLDTKTGQFVEKQPERTKYAILSHTWDTVMGEQTYKELKKIQRCYGPRTQLPAPQSAPGNSNGSPMPCFLEQDRDIPTSTSFPSPLRQDTLSVAATPSPASSELSIPRILHVDTHDSVFSPGSEPLGVPPAPVSNDPPIPASSGSFSPSSNDPTAPASRDLPASTSNDVIGTPSGDPPTPFQEFPSKPPPKSIWDDPELSPKVRDACAVARENGYRYIWIDSCCIDKSSSSELSEAINSMYKWYCLAAVCYAYLADVPPGDEHQPEGSRFRRSRWFTRGWTLQELIAPLNVVFLSKDWSIIGLKQALVNLIHCITKIDSKALLKQEPLEAFSVAQRLSWAASRETTREEDRAYSLLGIFDIHMPTLYGEGDRAFRRLQEQIMQRIPDQSLFAWGEVYRPGFSKPHPNPDITDPPTIRASGARTGQSLLAVSPDAFKSGGSIHTLPHHTTHRVQFPASHDHCQPIEYTSTPYGIRAQFQMIPLTPDLLSGVLLGQRDVQFQLPRSDSESQWYLAILGCEHAEHPPGHFLGRVCYVPPSESGMEFVYSGYIRFRSKDYTGPRPVLFPLSPEIIERCRPHTKLKMVYMSHPERTNLPSSLRSQPYTAIKFVLLTKTADSLRSQGYSVDLREPDSDHPATHWLTLSKEEDTITILFQHTLENDGERLTINVEVEISTSRPCLQLNAAASDRDQADRHVYTVSWNDDIPWGSLDHERVVLSTAEAETLAVDLDLGFAGNGFYTLYVDVLDDASSAVEAAEAWRRRGGGVYPEDYSPPA